MITHDEMKKFCKMLDEEYTHDILPKLQNAQGAIDTLLNLVYNDKIQNKRKRVGYETLKFGYLGDITQRIIGKFGYFADSCNNYQIFHHNPSSSIISYLGYSTVAYGENGGVWDILCRADNYVGNDAERVGLITTLKKRFNEIKAAYSLFFKENDGRMFKDFGNVILNHCKKIEEADSKKDDEIYALFNDCPHMKNIKITINIEEV